MRTRSSLLTRTALALPRRASWITSAPAARASLAVPSVDPLSTTRMRASGNAPRYSDTTDAIPFSSFRQGMSTASVRLSAMDHSHSMAMLSPSVVDAVEQIVERRGHRQGRDERRSDGEEVTRAVGERRDYLVGARGDEA